MNRKLIITATVILGIASSAVIATAHDRGERGGRGPAMLFERFDADKDGSITKAEVEAAAVARFTEADANGDGMLSAEEMTAAAEARQSKRHTNRIAKRIEKHDANGDGMISLEEMTTSLGEGRMEKMFDHLDADGDGVITQAEADAAKHMRGGRHGRRDGNANN